MALWKIPAVVLAFLTWWSAPPAGLADAGRRETLRRQFTQKATRTYTNADLPAEPPAPPTPPAAAPPAGEPPATDVTAAATPPAEAPPAEAKSEDAKHDEAWWRDRLATALANLDRDQGLAEAMQSRINALTTDWVNRDNPVQKSQLFEQRQRALAELDRLTKQVALDHTAIDGVREDARRQGVPAGWVR